MSEETKDEAAPSKENEAEGKANATEGAKGQVKALLTLVPVLGVLWAIVHFLPKFTDWTEKKMEGLNSDGAVAVSEKPGSIPAGEGGIEAESLEAKVEETAEPVVSSASGELKEYLQLQLIEQLGGPEKIEVRHIALTEDETRMVAAVKIIEDEQGSHILREIYFERDEFGRYEPREDSEFAERLKLWSD